VCENRINSLWRARIELRSDVCVCARMLALIFAKRWRPDGRHKKRPQSLNSEGGGKGGTTMAGTGGLAGKCFSLQQKTTSMRLSLVRVSGNYWSRCVWAEFLRIILFLPRDKWTSFIDTQSCNVICWQSAINLTPFIFYSPIATALCKFYSCAIATVIHWRQSLIIIPPSPSAADFFYLEKLCEKLPNRCWKFKLSRKISHAWKLCASLVLKMGKSHFK
jgi:hypothetical protein